MVRYVGIPDFVGTTRFFLLQRKRRRLYCDIFLKKSVYILLQKYWR